MDYPTLLLCLENHLQSLLRKGGQHLNIEAMPKIELQELIEGLRKIVPGKTAISGQLREVEIHEKQIRGELMKTECQQVSISPPMLKQNGAPSTLFPPSADSLLFTGKAEKPIPGPQAAAPDWPAHHSSTPAQCDNLRQLGENTSGCMRCPLGETRNRLVFGSGLSRTSLLFIGEGPGADEDAQGEPFVGRAGKLLTKMINTIGIDREDVYITNVVKCRPPGNRNPEPVEIASCMSILERQLELIDPRLIVTLGNVPTRALIPNIPGITKARGKPLQFRKWTLLPTFHPSYLLRNRSAMSLAWKDFREISALAFSKNEAFFRRNPTLLKT